MKTGFALLTVLLAALTLPAVAATPLTVKELGALIAGMQQQNKSDSQIAEKLKEVSLSEQLTPAGIEQLRAMNLGPETQGQVRVLVTESALLPPPAADLPTTAAPDVDTQKAVLGKAATYVAEFTQLPRLTADKTTVRFQNGPDYIFSSDGGVRMAQANLGQQFAPDNPYFQVMGERKESVEVSGGVEVLPTKIKEGDPGTENGQIAEEGPGPELGAAFDEASKGKLQFERWETVNGKPLAVFSFEVPKKQARYEVSYCCFPETQNVGSHLGGPAGSSSISGMGPGGGGGGGGSPMSYATLTTFEPFHTKVGYHGEFFIDPASGDVLRFVMEADLKKSDFVREDDTRIDYGPVIVNGKTMILPVQSFVLTTLVPAGDSGQRVAERRTLLEIHYANYHTPGQ